MIRSWWSTHPKPSSCSRWLKCSLQHGITQEWFVTGSSQYSRLHSSPHSPVVGHFVSPGANPRHTKPSGQSVGQQNHVRASSVWHNHPLGLAPSNVAKHQFSQSHRHATSPLQSPLQRNVARHLSSPWAALRRQTNNQVSPLHSQIQPPHNNLTSHNVRPQVNSRPNNVQSP